MCLVLAASGTNDSSTPVPRLPYLCEGSLCPSRLWTSEFSTLSCEGETLVPQHPTSPAKAQCHQAFLLPQCSPAWLRRRQRHCSKGHSACGADQEPPLRPLNLDWVNQLWQAQSRASRVVVGCCSGVSGCHPHAKTAVGYPLHGGVLGL